MAENKESKYDLNLKDLSEYTKLWYYVRAIRDIKLKVGAQYRAAKTNWAEGSIDALSDSGQLSNYNRIIKESGAFNHVSGLDTKELNNLATLAKKLSDGENLPTTHDVDEAKRVYDYKKSQAVDSRKNSVESSKKELKSVKTTYRKAQAKSSVAWLLAVAAALGLGALTSGYGYAVYKIISAALTSTAGLASGFAIGGLALGIIGGRLLIKGIAKTFKYVKNLIKTRSEQRKVVKEKYKQKQKAYQENKDAARAIQDSIDFDNFLNKNSETYPGKTLFDKNAQQIYDFENVLSKEPRFGIGLTEEELNDPEIQKTLKEERKKEHSEKLENLTYKKIEAANGKEKDKRTYEEREIISYSNLLLKVIGEFEKGLSNASLKTNTFEDYNKNYANDLQKVIRDEIAQGLADGTLSLEDMNEENEAFNEFVENLKNPINNEAERIIKETQDAAGIKIPVDNDLGKQIQAVKVIEKHEDTFKQLEELEKEKENVDSEKAKELEEAKEKIIKEFEAKDIEITFNEKTEENFDDDKTNYYTENIKNLLGLKTARDNNIDREKLKKALKELSGVDLNSKELSVVELSNLMSNIITYIKKTEENLNANPGGNPTHNPEQPKPKYGEKSYQTLISYLEKKDRTPEDEIQIQVLSEELDLQGKSLEEIKQIYKERFDKENRGEKGDKEPTEEEVEKAVKKLEEALNSGKSINEADSDSVKVVRAALEKYNIKLGNNIRKPDTLKEKIQQYNKERNKNNPNLNDGKNPPAINNKLTYEDEFSLLNKTIKQTHSVTITDADQDVNEDYIKQKLKDKIGEEKYQKYNVDGLSSFINHIISIKNGKEIQTEEFLDVLQEYILRYENLQLLGKSSVDIKKLSYEEEKQSKEIKKQLEKVENAGIYIDYTKMIKNEKIDDLINDLKNAKNPVTLFKRNKAIKNSGQYEQYASKIIKIDWEPDKE